MPTIPIETIFSFRYGLTNPIDKIDQIVSYGPTSQITINLLDGEDIDDKNNK